MLRLDGSAQMSRNRASAKAAGRTWETEIVAALLRNGWPHAERRRLAGAADKGDITGVVGVVIEAKNTAKIDISAALNEAAREKKNANAAIGAAWIKRRGYAKAEQGYVVIDGATFMQLLREAGYK